jgi:hypothetical protein
MSNPLSGSARRARCLGDQIRDTDDARHPYPEHKSECDERNVPIRDEAWRQNARNLGRWTRNDFEQDVHKILMPIRSSEQGNDALADERKTCDLCQRLNDLQQKNPIHNSSPAFTKHALNKNKPVPPRSGTGFVVKQSA